jgi:hypothetical protein
MLRRTGILMAAGAALIVNLLIWSIPASAVASTANPLRGTAMGGSSGRSVSTPGATIKAVVVKSWGQCSSGSLVWDDLNANWSSYGSTPISIDYSNPQLCGASFTLAALEASGADVVILDDVAGGEQVFTAQEIADLTTYASEGHNLLATYVTFSYSGFDNTALAPLFGLKKGAGWTGGDNQINATYTLHRKKAKALLRHIPNPYQSIGLNYSQRPGDGAWSKNELAGGVIAGINGDKSAAIISYKGPGYYATYIASMPEYGGGTEDEQFIYNAIIHA